MKMIAFFPKRYGSLIREICKASKVSEDWIQLVSNYLYLPSNEPETWAVAARLLPHALDAVQQAYSGVKSEKPPVRVSEAWTGSGMSQPTKTLLAGARNYFDDSRSRYERTCYVVMPLGNPGTGESRYVSLYNERQGCHPAANRGESRL
jgi:hypothetical protein